MTTQRAWQILRHTQPFTAWMLTGLAVLEFLQLLAFLLTADWWGALGRLGLLVWTLWVLALLLENVQLRSQITYHFWDQP